jgi:hypothetical protein
VPQSPDQRSETGPPRQFPPGGSSSNPPRQVGPRGSGGGHEGGAGARGTAMRRLTRLLASDWPRTANPDTRGLGMLTLISSYCVWPWCFAAYLVTS